MSTEKSLKPKAGLKPAIKTAEKPSAKPVAKLAVKEEKAKAAEYGVGYLADALGIDSSKVRQKLRKAGIAKNGKSYGYTTKKDADEIVKQLKNVKLKNEA